MTTQELIAENRRSLIIYAQRCGSISRACQSFGVSRTTFYKIKEQYLKTGSLAPRIRRKAKVPHETSLTKKKLLLKLVYEHPSWGPEKYSYELRKNNICFRPWAVWYTLRRFDLNNKWKRFVYIEQLKAQDQPLTERTLRTVRKGLDKKYKGLWPGHTVSVDTFYVGCLKGVGRIYQITGLDLASRFGFAKLYLANDQVATTDFIENKVIPAFFNNGLAIDRVLSDNGSEYTGRLFNKCLQDYEIRHVHIPPGKPVCNAYVERFQRTVNEEFYQKAFRTQLFKTLDQLQSELDKYLMYYNFERPHFGVNPQGAIPVDILKTRRTVLDQRFKELTVNLTVK